MFIDTFGSNVTQAMVVKASWRVVKAEETWGAWEARLLPEATRDVPTATVLEAEVIIHLLSCQTY